MTRIALGGRSPSGLRWPNYVNGRLLTALDLTTDDDAVRRRDRWLGRAIGPGVAEGFEVSGSPGASTLLVPPGTGVSLGGTAVHLDVPATLDLNVVTASAPVDDAAFGDCIPPTTETKAPVAGPYLLVARRGRGSYEGKVPVVGGPTATLPTPCTARWQVEDVEFAALRLDGFTTPTTDADRRNQLAHWCFGTAALEPLAMSGFTAPVPYSGLAALADLDGCDVPLAVFHWTGTALTFVDRWSARRRPMRPSAATAGVVGGLATVLDDTRTAEGEARFLQFQEQLAGLLATPAGQSVRALDSFPLLPPAGLVPFEPSGAAAGEQLAATLATLQADAPDTDSPGTSPWQFFEGVSLRFGVVDHESVDFTLRRSWYDEPIDLSRGPTVDVFFVEGGNGETIAPYVLFTKQIRGPRWIWTE
jgi:hypothetical protein